MRAVTDTRRRSPSENDPGANPAVVVSAYDRPLALQRLLSSLLDAEYPRGTPVPLLISLDQSPDLDLGRAVLEVAESVPWPHGPKRIIAHERHLGLRDHILACGDLSSEYPGVIVLEDDLYVSPQYYSFAHSALELYGADPRISGISLYNHRKIPYLGDSFHPLDDGYDVYFLQFASSWGQAWTGAMWGAFRRWYDEGVSVSASDDLPDAVIEWPDSSWLKYFIKYMVESDSWFVYPRTSLCTNFGDPGIHFAKATPEFQVPLLLGERPFRLPPLDASQAIYDAYFEPAPRMLSLLMDSKWPKDTIVDLYGQKRIHGAEAAPILTTREVRASAETFGNEMVPAIMNVVAGVPGEDIRYSTTASVLPSDRTSEESRGRTRAPSGPRWRRWLGICIRHVSGPWTRLRNRSR